MVDARVGRSSSSNKPKTSSAGCVQDPYHVSRSADALPAVSSLLKAGKYVSWAPLVVTYQGLLVGLYAP